MATKQNENPTDRATGGDFLSECQESGLCGIIH